MPARARMPRGTPTPMPALAPVLRDEWVDEEGASVEEDEVGFVADGRVLTGVAAAAAAAVAVMMTG